MTAFLRIDRCRTCHEECSWEWVNPIVLNGRTLAGTGVWRSQLIDGMCPRCHDASLCEREGNRAREITNRLLRVLLGGPKPYREFTFDRYRVDAGNQLAFELAKGFDPARHSLYLWGPCGVGKTHLAYATARAAFEQGRSIVILKAAQISRKVRMRDPQDEQDAIDRFVRAEVLVLDDLGIGTDTPYARQILQEILDARDFRDRAGLVVTSPYSLEALAGKLNEDTIPSRLAGMCRVVEVSGADNRLTRNAG